MLTRREVLTGTAAASIAAIASARGIAVADVGCGDMRGSVLGAFTKEDAAVGVFLKWETTRAEVFYKQESLDGVQVFFKFFDKHRGGWTPVTAFFLKELASLEGAAAHFLKIDAQGAEFFIKSPAGAAVLTRLGQGEDGVQIGVEEYDLSLT